MKVFLFNPSNGAPIKNWYDGSNRWSLDVDEVKSFPSATADKLVEIYGFLQRLSEGEAETKLAKVEDEKPAQVKVGPLGNLVPKAPEELAQDEEETKEKKVKAKKLVEKVKKAKDAEPENPPYEEWSRGELITEAHKLKIEIKGLGKSKITKEQLVNLLNNEKKS